MKLKRAIITAAGFGSRFLPITKTFPKEMIPILEKPVIHYLVEECMQAGIEEVIIVTQESEIKVFEDYFYGRATSIRTLMIRQGKFERWNKVEKIFDLPKITIIPQDERIPYGNGRPVLSAKDLVMNDDAFVVMWGDDIVVSKESAVKQLIDHFLIEPSDGVLAVQEVSEEECTKYGMVKIKNGTGDQIERIIEKPNVNESPSKLASYGRYILTPKIFNYLKPELIGKDNEIWLQDANDKLIQDGGKMFVKKIDGKWITTGDPINYLRAFIEVALFREDTKDEVAKILKNLAGQIE